MESVQYAIKFPHILNMNIVIKELNIKNNLLNKNEECSICYEIFTNVKQMYILDKCNHIFCKKCIFHHMNINEHIKNIYCPLCRTEYNNVKYKLNNNFGGMRVYLYGQRFIHQHLIAPQLPPSFVSLGSLNFDGDELSSFQNNIGNRIPYINSQTQTFNNNNNENDNEADIILVMNQAQCTRELAINALNNNNYDIVNAIMDLTM